MDTDGCACISLMQSMYDFIHAKALTSHYGEVVRDSCYGCEVSHPSQHQHSCVMLSYEDHIHTRVGNFIFRANGSDEKML